MRLGPLFRLFGTILYGFIGWEIGITIVGTAELTTETWTVIVPATLIGAAFGFVFAPWLVIAPARAARNARKAPSRAGTINSSSCLGMPAGNGEAMCSTKSQPAAASVGRRDADEEMARLVEVAAGGASSPGRAR